MPGRSTGRVRQRNEIKMHALAARGKLTANNILELRHRHELADRQLADGNYQSRLEDLDLTIKPVPASTYFRIRRHSIPTRRFLAGKTPADCCHVNQRTKLGLR